MRFIGKELFGSLRITKAGALYTLLSIFIGVAAINTGNNILFVMVSLLLSFMWLSGLFARLNLARLEAKISAPQEIFAKKKSTISLQLRKRLSVFPGFLLRVEMTLRDPEGKSYHLREKVPFLKGEREIYLNFEPQKRGLYRKEELRISSLFPMGLFVRSRRLPLEGEWIVFPEPKKCIYGDMKKDKFVKEGELKRAQLGPTLFERLEDYYPGTPRRLISWKSLAKWEELKRKVFIEGENPPLIIEIDRLPGVDLEEKLSCATYLVLEASKRGNPIGLKLGNNLILSPKGENNRGKILRELALYG